MGKKNFKYRHAFLGLTLVALLAGVGLLYFFVVPLIPAPYTNAYGVTVDSYVGFYLTLAVFFIFFAGILFAAAYAAWMNWLK